MPADTSASRGDPDASNGYEALATDFLARRSASSVGAATVRAWAALLPPNASVLDLGCGSGVPISQALVDAGCAVAGVDASPTLIAAFRAQFPAASAECCAVEHSSFFDRQFDGVVAWGLMFLLAPNAQATLVHRVATALKPGGRFLFTAPAQRCEWTDVLTGRTSISLGADAYRGLIEGAGMILERETEDEGENHYYVARRSAGGGGL